MNLPELVKIVLPWWQDGETIPDEKKEPYFLTQGVKAFWKRVYGWMTFPLNQLDALTCSETLLDLMAWDRDITRFEGEPLSLYRKRVKYAAVNAKDAGSVVGFKRIFERLGIGIVAFKERENSEQWDVCTIELTDSDISQNSKLIQVLIEQYGRTCRRYRFQVSYPAQVHMVSGEFSYSFATFSAARKEAVEITVEPTQMSNGHHVYRSSLIQGE